MMRELLLLVIAVLAVNPLSVRAEEDRVVVGGWSETVTDSAGAALRGRLVLREKAGDAGVRNAAVYVELQESSQAVGRSLWLYCDLGKTDFRPEYRGGLTCDLQNADREPVPSQSFPFSGATPVSEWIRLPCDATVRLRASPFGLGRPGGLAISPHLGQLWVIDNEDREEYFLSGEFIIDPPADAAPPASGGSFPAHVWRGVLKLPPLRISSDGMESPRTGGR